MANFPGATNTIPGVYGPTDYYFIHQKSELRIGWAGGIFLDKGNWLDAAIAFRIGLQSRYNSDKRDSFRLGHIKIDKNLDIFLDIPEEGSLVTPDATWRHGKPNYAEESRENFPELKKHYDSIKNLKAFW